VVINSPELRRYLLLDWPCNTPRSHVRKLAECDRSLSKRYEIREENAPPPSCASSCRCASGCLVERQICNREVAGSG